MSSRLIEKLRQKCLKRGQGGINGLGRMFRIMDDDRSKSLDLGEFKRGLADYGLNEDEAQEIFQCLEKDGSHKIRYDEFLRELRPPMNEIRQKIVKEAFEKADKTGDGQLTVADLKSIFNPRRHPKYMRGEMNETQVMEEFLAGFEGPDEKDGVVTWEEFLNHYSGASSACDDDAYFDLMMRNCWKL